MNLKKMIVVETYDELQGYATDFAEGRINLLFVVGEPGHGKSQAFTAATEGRADCHRLDGHVTPLGFYADLWANRDKNVWIDDVDDLNGTPLIIQMLKSLCQTNEFKSMRWMSSRPILVNGVAVPSQFTTTSRVAVITNDWKTLNKNVGALENRGIALRFAPSPAEIHASVRAWFKDDEVYAFIGDMIRGLRKHDPHDMRTYIHALELKNAGKDWRKLVGNLLDVAPISDTNLAGQLHCDPTLTGVEKLAEYGRRARKPSRASYFRNQKRWMELHRQVKVRL